MCIWAGQTHHTHLCQHHSRPLLPQHILLCTSKQCLCHFMLLSPSRCIPLSRRCTHLVTTTMRPCMPPLPHQPWHLPLPPQGMLTCMMCITLHMHTLPRQPNRPLPSHRDRHPCTMHMGTPRLPLQPLGQLLPCQCQHKFMSHKHMSVHTLGPQSLCRAPMPRSLMCNSPMGHCMHWPPLWSTCLVLHLQCMLRCIRVGTQHRQQRLP